jgi:hypothetical protein
MLIQERIKHPRSVTFPPTLSVVWLWFLPSKTNGVTPQAASYPSPWLLFGSEKYGH